MDSTLEERVTSLERHVEQIAQELRRSAAQPKRDWRSVVGIFADDPLFEEAVRLGKEYRDSVDEDAEVDIDNGKGLGKA